MRGTNQSEDERRVNLRTLQALHGAGHETKPASGAWPSGPDIDRLIIQRMIDVYGRNGHNIWPDDEDQDPPRP